MGTPEAGEGGSLQSPVVAALLWGLTMISSPMGTPEAGEEWLSTSPAVAALLRGVTMISFPAGDSASPLLHKLSLHIKLPQILLKAGVEIWENGLL